MRAQRSTQFDEPEGAATRLGGFALDNPVATGGVLVMVLTATLIAANALSFQPGRHPAPLFGAWGGADRPPAYVPATAPTPQPSPHATELVREIQVSLQRGGYYAGPLDGVLGPMTDDAVRAYQRATGLSAGGEVSHALLAHMLMNSGPAPARTTATSPVPATLERAPASVPVPPAPVPARAPGLSPASSGAERATVRAVQQALADLGYGPVTIDGMIGVETASAIRRFELDRGIAITGKPRPEVYVALERTAGVKIPR